MEDILETLFESVPKIRLLRLFLQNPTDAFSLEEIKKRTQIKGGAVARELAKLARIDFIASKNVRVKDELRHKKSSRRKPPKVVKLFFLNPEFRLLDEVRDLVIKSATTSRKRLMSQIKRLGRIKLAIISGIFINNDNTRTDLLIVGDDVKQGALARFLQQLESDLGKPIQYTVMDIDEYKYRMDMYDRFLRDILDKPHEKLINKLHN